MTVELGTVREVWLEELDTGAKHSFLIRDDAFSRGGAVFGKTVRLGEPVNLGPSSTWRQTSWEGGEDQETWRDPAMYYKGSADVASERGKVKLWNALGVIHEVTGRTNVDRLTLGRNATSASRSVAVPLFMGECNAFADTGPTGGFALYRKDPGGALTTLKSDFASGITAFSPMDDNSVRLYIGTANGEVWAYNPADGTVTLDYTDTNGRIQLNSMVLYNDSLFWAAGRTVTKRTWKDGVVTYTPLFRPNGCQVTRGLVVWNNKLWFGSITLGGKTRMFVSDGSTTVQAFEFPDEFHIHATKVHYGSLYIAGSRPGADRTSWIGQVWRYTGASLVKLYEEGTGEDGEDHSIFDLAVDRQFLGWPQHALASNGYVSGIRMYDPETDALFLGPNRSEGQTVMVHSLETYDQTWVASFNPPGSGTVTCRPIRKLGRTRLSATGTVSQHIESSTYDGELPGEQKVWLQARLHCKLAHANTSLELWVSADGGGYSLVGTVAYDAGNTGWRTASLPMKVGGQYVKSTTLRYKLVFKNSDANAESVGNPVVDAVEIDWMPAPKKRRQWALRVLATDGQLRLDGTANPLSTASAIQAKLEELYGKAFPVKFYDPKTTGGTPTSGGVEVWISEWLEQNHRIDSSTNEVGGETSLRLLEANPS